MTITYHDHLECRTATNMGELRKLKARSPDTCLLPQKMPSRALLMIQIELCRQRNKPAQNRSSSCVPEHLQSGAQGKSWSGSGLLVVPAAIAGDDGNGTLRFRITPVGAGGFGENGTNEPFGAHDSKMQTWCRCGSILFLDEQYSEP